MSGMEDDVQMMDIMGGGAGPAMRSLSDIEDEPITPLTSVHNTRWRWQE